MKYSYDYYRVFYYVARYQSISRAANVLSISQPAVTHTIKNLEQSLGCELFNRTNSGVILTEKGETLYNHVKESFRQLTIGEEKIISEMDNVNRSISIGFSVSLSATIMDSLIIPPIALYHKEHSETYITTYNKPTPELINSVKDGLLDMAIITSSDIQKELKNSGRILYSYKDLVVAGNEFKSRFKKPVYFADLIEFPIVGFGKGTETYSMYDRMFAEGGRDTRVDIEVSNHEQNLSFVKNNMGITAMPEYLAKPAIKEGTIFAVKLKDEIPKRFISIIRNEGSNNNSAAILEDYIISHSRTFPKR
ncbi:MAG: LysR family transcriptional regulator [Lachnospiraceae bacterium]|nr:LysR family transcriptional regulator [Lachnospiraceae bacterium]